MRVRFSDALLDGAIHFLPNSWRPTPHLNPPPQSNGRPEAGVNVVGPPRYSQPPVNPARRSPSTKYGQRRVISQIRPVR